MNSDRVKEVFSQIENIVPFNANTLSRKALKRHLQLISKVLVSIESVENGVEHHQYEEQYIEKCLKNIDRLPELLATIDTAFKTNLELVNSLKTLIDYQIKIGKIKNV